MNSIRKIILPIGKVHPQYMNYIGWSFASNLIVSAESAISAHSMLQAIDTTGDSDIIRTVNYVGKDIIGQLGGLLYMSNIGTKIDDNPRRFIMYSNIFQQAAFIFVCSTPVFPSWFLPIAGLSNVLFNLSFTGFGAVNAKCITKLAINDNIGELYAKISIINTIGSSAGLILGLGINAIFPEHNSRMLVLPFLAVGRVYTYNRAIEHLIDTNTVLKK